MSKEPDGGNFSPINDYNPTADGGGQKSKNGPKFVKKGYDANEQECDHKRWGICERGTVCLECDEELTLGEDVGCKVFVRDMKLDFEVSTSQETEQEEQQSNKVDINEVLEELENQKTIFKDYDYAKEVEPVAYIEAMKRLLKNKFTDNKNNN